MDGNRGSGLAGIDDRLERALWRAHTEDNRHRRTRWGIIGYDGIYLDYTGYFTRRRPGVLYRGGGPADCDAYRIVEPGAGAGVMLPVIAPATGMPVANIWITEPRAAG